VFRVSVSESVLQREKVINREKIEREVYLRGEDEGECEVKMEIERREWFEGMIRKCMFSVSESIDRREGDGGWIGEVRELWSGES